MTDNLSPEDRRRTMQAVKGKATSLERRLFAMLAGMHVSGWRRNADDVLGKPDVVFDELRIAVFADGCFWHGCPICLRPLPLNNRQYWIQKISRNQERAQEYDRRLSQEGWLVIRFWEHEFRDPESTRQVRKVIRSAIQSRSLTDERLIPTGSARELCNPSRMD